MTKWQAGVLIGALILLSSLQTQAQERSQARSMVISQHGIDLMAIYKDPRHEAAVRMDAAKAALSFEKSRLAPADPQRAADDHVPLAERLKEYARDDAIEASAGKVVEFTSPTSVMTSRRDNTTEPHLEVSFRRGGH
jgi:hypothetical protein